MADERVWVTIPMSPDMKLRIKKAAARNNSTIAEYLRSVIVTYMQETSEWSLPGPKKGAS